MYYAKLIESGYVVGICTSETQLANRITEDEANRLNQTFLSAPNAPDGYTYRLRADNLEWELVELPGTEQVDENADVSDYENALSDLGVRFGD